MVNILNQRDPASVLLFALTLSVGKFLFVARYEAKYTINNWQFVQFTFSRAIKADKKRKLGMKISNA